MSNDQLIEIIESMKSIATTEMRWMHLEMLSGSKPTGDMALELFENGIEEMAQETWEDYAPEGLNVLLEEAENRNIDLGNILT